MCEVGGWGGGGGGERERERSGKRDPVNPHGKKK